MNDFTKEELEWIYGHMPSYFRDREDPNMFPRVVDKLKSLIDNYREIKTPKMAAYCCKACNEEWINCECKK